MQPRSKLWTTRRETLALAAAGQPGQKSFEVLDNLQAGLGLAHLAGYTVIHTEVRILLISSSSETSILPNDFHFGITRQPGSIDDGDFPALELYEGDYYFYTSLVLQLPGAVDTLLKPAEHAIIRHQSGASRRISDVGQAFFFVAQQRVAEAVDAHVVVSSLVLMP